MNGRSIGWCPSSVRSSTSTYYAGRYPGWLTLARPDSAAYEGDGVHTAFPHVSEAENPPGDALTHNFWAYDQPRADDGERALILMEDSPLTSHNT